MSPCSSTPWVRATSAPLTRDALVAYLEQYKSELDEESQRRMYSNPLRVLDSKDEKVQAILVGAPRLFDHLG